MSESRAERLRKRMPAIDPDTLPPPAPVLTTVPEPSPETPPSRVSSPSSKRPETKAPSSQKAPTRPTPARTANQPTQGSWETAVDDPKAIEGKNDYISFYLPVRTKLRFAAAIYWLSRDRHAAGKVPDNMSQAITQYMEQLADDLEREYNDGKVFPPTPEQLKVSKRKRS